MDIQFDDLVQPGYLQLNKVKTTSGSISPAFLGDLAQRFGVEVFVETGTYLGDTTAEAVRIFREVHTIELSEELYQRATQRFSGQNNVHVYLGDSANVLAQLLPTLQGRVLFWLDGHYSEGITARGRQNTPVLDELYAINHAGVTDAIVLIDDMRCFQPGNPEVRESLRGYPSVSQVQKVVQDINPHATFVIHGDLALCMCSDHQVRVSPLLQACTVSRTYTHETGDIESVLSAEEVISQACGIEKEAIQALCRDFQTSEKHGLGGQYRLWNGLVQTHAGAHTEASRDFTQAIRLGCNHWRVKWYLARALNNAGAVAQAHQVLQEVLRVAPDFHPARGLAETITTTSPAAAVPVGSSGGMDMELTGEKRPIVQCIDAGNVVFDVGASLGLWTNTVLQHCSDVSLHVFEPVPQAYQRLIENLVGPISDGKVVPHNIGIAQKEGIRTFYYYEDSPTWSTFYRRIDIENQYNLKSPISLNIQTNTITEYCQKHTIKRINYLKIDVEGGEFDVLKGARGMLQKGAIDYIQFEYGGTFLDADITLQQVYDYLRRFRYEVFQILPDRLAHIPQFLPQHENYQYSNFLAVNERFRSHILGLPPSMLNVQHLCMQHRITPRGVLHVGAHEGKELKAYLAMGVEQVLFIEPNPAVFEQLQANIVGAPHVHAVRCAISDRNGKLNLHVTSMDQSSSILPLKRHRDIYPSIKETHQVTVESRRLDSLLQELQLSPCEYNMLYMDIQGAELLALQGASETLKHIEAINTEINYEELYEGGALIDQIDAYLDEHGFTRVATTTPYHASWGDAFYVRKPVITMSTLGLNGRFANQIFQYAFLKIYAKEHDLGVETPPWIGGYLFGCDDPPLSKPLPVVRQHTYKLAEDQIPNAKAPFKNVDFWGYFQYHTSYYVAHKDYFRSLFRPAPEVETTMQAACTQLRAQGKTIVGVHLRRGDYGYGHFFIAPTAWYKDWLQGLWETLEDPVLFIASDEPENVLDDFADYNPVTAKDLGAMLPEAAFYPDFYLLSQCDIVAISNSSFSFASCMLNERGKQFYRPHLPSRKLLPFDPWNSETIFREAKVEDDESGAKLKATPNPGPPSPWPAWLPPKHNVEELLAEFLDLYAQRPIKHNEGGVKSIGAFNLWFFLRKTRPNLVIESGVWKGLTTWLIENTLPDANIICLDPHPEVRQYISRKATYLTRDFVDTDFEEYDLSNALVFFDDHQNAYERLLQAKSKGFKHLIFDDNYPGDNNSHLTLQACLSSIDDKSDHLHNIIEKYEIFPPLFQYNEPITMEKFFIDIPALNVTDTPAFELLKNEMYTYRWMTYVKLVKHMERGRMSQERPKYPPVDVTSNSAAQRDENEPSPHPSCNVLVSFLSPREVYRPVIMSTGEVFCGPDCQTTVDGPRYRTINTPAGVYDIAPIVDRLPQVQKPELFVVKADATCRNFPVNLRVLSCPKLLILGNTQHLAAPLQTLLTYAEQEQFDFIMSDHKRHHLHYFKEAGFENVFWIPGFNIFPHPQPWHETWDYPVSFVGQMGVWHPYRKYILEWLTKNGVSISHFQAPQDKAAEIYAQSLINLNCSLNGDMNLRIFEVLSSGGFLMTDRLSEQSGLSLLFRDEEHCVYYDNENDLKKKIDYFLNDADKARHIAKNGYEEFQRNHRPETKISELMDYLSHGKVNPLYDICQEKRSVYIQSASPAELRERASLYEMFQEMHLRHTGPLGLFWPGVDARLACDVADLPRLKLFIKGDVSELPRQTLQLVQDTGMVERMACIPTAQLQQEKVIWDVVAITGRELVLLGLDTLLGLVAFRQLMIVGACDGLEDKPRRELEGALILMGLVNRSASAGVYDWHDKTHWGEMLFAANKITEAIKCFEEILLETPDDVRALNNLGVISYQFDNLEAAEQLLSQAVSLDRRHLNSLVNLAQVYVKTERYAPAAPLFNDAVALDNHDPDLWNSLALCATQMGETTAALSAYEHSYALDAEQPTVLKAMHELKSLQAPPLQVSRPSILPPQRILVINNLYPPQELGGYGRLLADFATLLKHRGHTLHVLTSNTPYLGHVPEDEPGIDRSLELFGAWQGGVTRAFDKELALPIVRRNVEVVNTAVQAFSPDLCLLGNIDFLSHYVVQPLLLNGIPVIHHLGNHFPGYSVAETPQSAWYRLATASAWLRDDICRQGYPLDDIRVIYPGALVREFAMPMLPALDKLRIAYASIVLPYKGPHVLLNALKRLHEAGIDFACTMAGTSTDEEFVNQLKQFVISNGMDKKIDFVGFLPREALKDLYARHNVLAFPSIFQEPFGISQVEAMAAGVTVVSSGVGGSQEIIEDGISGVIFRSEDDLSLAQELTKLPEDRERWRRIALAGQRRALERFDIETSVDTLEQIFGQLKDQ